MYDRDLEEVVRRFGGTITYPIDHDKMQLFSTIKNIMLDCHPDISWYIKMFSWRGDQGWIFELNDMCTWQEVL